MTRTYSDCYYCGGEVTEHYLTRQIWWEGSLHLVENVPVGVCRQCGQKVILPEVARQIDDFLSRKTKPAEYARVPVYHFPDPETVK